MLRRASVLVETKSHNAKLIVNIALSSCIALFGVLLAANASSETKLFYAAVFFFYLGSIFFASYFYQKSLVLFNAVIWVCETLSFPQSRKMAFVYAAIFFGVGCWNFYQWLFIEPA